MNDDPQAAPEPGDDSPADETPAAGRPAAEGRWVSEELAEMSPAELKAHVRHWTDRYETARQTPGQGERAWWASKILAGSKAELARRRARSQRGDLGEKGPSLASAVKSDHVLRHRCMICVPIQSG